MLRDGNLFEIESLSEVGAYSALFIDSEKNEILLNENFGTLMRTKGSHSNEGGVNTGYSVIDQPILFKEADDIVKELIKPNVIDI